MTAELATVLPAVVLVLGCCLGAVQVIGQQVRLTDAAADAARAFARGDPAERVAALVAAEVPGAHVSARSSGEFLCARLEAASGFGLFSVWGLRLQATSCALAGGL